MTVPGWKVKFNAALELPAREVHRVRIGVGQANVFLILIAGSRVVIEDLMVTTGSGGGASECRR